MLLLNYYYYQTYCFSHSITLWKQQLWINFSVELHQSSFLWVHHLTAAQINSDLWSHILCNPVCYDTHISCIRINNIFTEGPFAAELMSEAEAEVCSSIEYCSAFGDSMDPVATRRSSEVDFLWWRWWWWWWWWWWWCSFLSCSLHTNDTD